MTTAQFYATQCDSPFSVDVSIVTGVLAKSDNKPGLGVIWLFVNHPQNLLERHLVTCVKCETSMCFYLPKRRLTLKRVMYEMLIHTQRVWESANNVFLWWHSFLNDWSYHWQINRPIESLPASNEHPFDANPLARETCDDHSNFLWKRLNPFSLQVIELGIPGFAEKVQLLPWTKHPPPWWQLKVWTSLRILTQPLWRILKKVIRRATFLKH